MSDKVGGVLVFVVLVCMCAMLRWASHRMFGPKPDPERQALIEEYEEKQREKRREEIREKVWRDRAADEIERDVELQRKYGKHWRLFRD